MEWTAFRALLLNGTAQFGPRQRLQKGRRFRAAARGYGLGSGNSIPEYVPVEGYLAMIEAAQHLRQSE